MKYVTRSDFDKVAAKDKYYSSIERWYKVASRVVREIGPSSVLELGPYLLQLVSGSDTIDRRQGLKPTIVHDARETPWPVTDKYDVFIALRVWEHLGDRHQQAFGEVQRIASHAVLSFPYRWNCPTNPSHHGIDDDRIRQWTCAVEPKSVRIIPLQDLSSSHSLSFCVALK